MVLLFFGWFSYFLDAAIYFAAPRAAIEVSRQTGSPSLCHRKPPHHRRGRRPARAPPNTFDRARYRPSPSEDRSARCGPPTSLLPADPAGKPRRGPGDSGSSAVRFMSTPMRRMRSPCCARTAIGHATAAPPRSVMNSRRLVCRESSIVKSDGDRFMTPPPSRLEARRRLGS
jgi:hypothetical protein